MKLWTALVKVYDTDTGEQIGTAWQQTAAADHRGAARAAIRAAAWTQVDSRLNDVGIALLTPPRRVRTPDGAIVHG